MFLKTYSPNEVIVNRGKPVRFQKYCMRSTLRSGVRQFMSVHADKNLPVVVYAEQTDWCILKPMCH